MRGHRDVSQGTRRLDSEAWYRGAQPASAVISECLQSGILIADMWWCAFISFKNIHTPSLGIEAR